MNDEMTIDERLRFLVQSTESLHASAQELHATVAEHTRQMQEYDARQKAVEAKERQLRTAMIAGIHAFLEGLRDNGKEK